MRPPELIEAVLRHRVLISRDGDDLVIDSPFGDRLPEGLMHMLRVHKQDVFAYLQWEDQADTLLLDSTRRIAAAWPGGCHLDDDPRWLSAEGTLHASYLNLELDELREAIRMRERVAFDIFADFRKERSR